MKTVLIYSGGMDSTVLLYSLLDLGRKVAALGVNYGQRHGKELQAAASICNKLGIEYRIADLTSLRQFLGGSSQTDDSVPVPHGHYAEDNMKVTVVPNRNALMLSVAAAWAISLKYNSVAYAAHAGDHAQYPDCRPQFIGAMRTLLCYVDWEPLLLEAPFSSRTKAEIAKIGYRLGVPFGETWSCYQGGELHCGLCGTCQERVWAFQAVGITDPTKYQGGKVPKLFPAPK